MLCYETGFSCRSVRCSRAFFVCGRAGTSFNSCFGRNARYSRAFYISKSNMPESSDCRPKAVKAVVGWKRPKARLVGAVFFCRGSRREPSGRYRFVLQKNCVRKGRLFRSKCVHKRKSIPNTESVRKTLPNAHFLRENWNYLYYSTSERKSLLYRA